MVSQLSINPGNATSSSSHCAQRIFPIEELEYIQNTRYTSYDTGIRIPTVDVEARTNQTLFGNNPAYFCETSGDKLISTGFTIYLF